MKLLTPRLSAEQWIDFTIENVNDAPYWTGTKLPVLLVREDQPFSLDLLDRSLC